MGNIRLFLRANEKLYINGAVVRFDRKVAIELLNEVEFLLENHVMQADDATTPLRQLYFVVQMMLMDPARKEAPMRLFNKMTGSLLETLESAELLEGLKTVMEDVSAGGTFKALKTLRGLFEIEDAIIQPMDSGFRIRMENELALSEGV